MLHYWEWVHESFVHRILSRITNSRTLGSWVDFLTCGNCTIIYAVVIFLINKSTIKFQWNEINCQIWIQNFSRFNRFNLIFRLIEFKEDNKFKLNFLLLTEISFQTCSAWVKLNYHMCVLQSFGLEALVNYEPVIFFSVEFRFNFVGWKNVQILRINCWE